MGNANEKLTPVKAVSVEAQKSDKPLKPCCACPETKKIRDECIITKGEEHCQHLIEAHKACMRSLGFNI
ncbi:Cytochrome c oxidase copper chaperone [Dufourea novaeangliae]|uniref:Cytochrome c oxidase copper chaperone n=1 Tax=Dufourea novaeangliae TaxID=178035 RepID=A0A154P134_DUFNO|nr:Cytochrome c oxidase copper chaperone [Dufourea novaeangliae]